MRLLAGVQGRLIHRFLEGWGVDGGLPCTGQVESVAVGGSAVCVQQTPADTAKRGASRVLHRWGGGTCSCLLWGKLVVCLGVGKEVGQLGAAGQAEPVAVGVGVGAGAGVGVGEGWGGGGGGAKSICCSCS
jgi:hypothetical protein